MNKYELTVVVSGKSTPAKQKGVIERTKKLIDGLKGNVQKVNEWGNVELMYQIKGNDSGIFFLFNIELNPSEVKKLNDKLKVEEDVIRSLLIKI